MTFKKTCIIIRGMALVEQARQYIAEQTQVSEISGEIFKSCVDLLEKNGKKEWAFVPIRRRRVVRHTLTSGETPIGVYIGSGRNLKKVKSVNVSFEGSEDRYMIRKNSYGNQFSGYSYRNLQQTSSFHFEPILEPLNTDRAQELLDFVKSVQDDLPS